MAWRFVKQPDGKLARFSEVVDSFTHANLTEAQAYKLARKDLGIEDAKRKVQRALDDEDPRRSGVKGIGGLRWRDAVETIERVHGEKVARETLAEMGFEPAPPTGGGGGK